MKTTTRFLQAATLIAITLTFSCSSDDSGGSNGTSNGSDVESSSSTPSATSSSSTPSVSQSSSSNQCNQTDIINGPSVSHGDEVYESVVICDQIWLARNLNYEVEGSKCYNNDPTNCAIYGRLYDWATAMDLPVSYNDRSCSDKIKPKHKGICPDDWHIPNNEDWDKLLHCIDGTSSTDSPYPYVSPTAGRCLKAKSGWKLSGNGEDTYGFSALPGGHGKSDDLFFDVGYYGRWWSASAYGNFNAYSRRMDDNHGRVEYGDYYRGYLYSVRCLKD